MNFKNLFCLFGLSLTVVLVLFSACNKNDGLTAELRGKWNFKQVNGIDVTAKKMYINIKENNEYIMYDGCNHGDGTYSTKGGSSIEFSSPGLTYKYCEIYKTVGPGALISEIHTYSIDKSTLTFRDDENRVIIIAERE